jgi:hypothetical protein
LPAPTLRADLDTGRVEAIDPPELREMMRHGLSIRFDPEADEAIATFPTSHAILVYDGATGAVKRATDTRGFGMDWPAGLVLLPDGAHYAVTGHDRGLWVFARGSHELRADLSLPDVELHGHSHSAAG